MQEMLDKETASLNVTNVISSCDHESKGKFSGTKRESDENRGSVLAFSGLVGKSMAHLALHIIVLVLDLNTDRC